MSMEGGVSDRVRRGGGTNIYVCCGAIYYHADEFFASVSVLIAKRK